MDSYLFLLNYQQLQNGVSYSEIVDIGFARFAYSEHDISPFENYALVQGELDDIQLKTIENTFRKFHRSPVVYFVSKENQVLADYLIRKEYKKEFEDSWLFHDGKIDDKSRFTSVRKIENKNDLEIFLSTLDNCFLKDDPQNPYGPITYFLKGSRIAWETYHASNRLQYYMACENGHPVATAMLNSYNGIGYISAVGSLQKVRGKGYGKLITLFCVNESVKDGNTLHCLSTEQDQYPYDFYRRIGFQDRFSALGYMKKVSK